MAEPAKWKVGAPGEMSECFCCKAEFVFTIDSGGLCDACNENECPKCYDDEYEDWL